jgi:hypothetical protein
MEAVVAGVVGGGADADSGICCAAAALADALSYGLVYARLSRSAGEACCGSRDGGRDPSRDGSCFKPGVMLKAVIPPELTAVNPAAEVTAGALCCRDVPFNSLCERGLS